jgi:hypothetical protein
MCRGGQLRRGYLEDWVILTEDIPLCLKSKIKTKSFKVSVKTQQCINILLWQRVSVLLGCLQTSIQIYGVLSIYNFYYFKLSSGSGMWGYGLD